MGARRGILCWISVALCHAWAAEGIAPACKWDGQEITLEPCFISAKPFNHVWRGKQRPTDQRREAFFALCEWRKVATFEVMGLATNIPAHLYPLSEESCLKRTPKGFEITITHPGQFVFDCGTHAPPIHLFADKPFRYTPAPNDIYFGPGVHNAGILSPKSGQRIVLDKGAVVHGALFLNQVTNVMVVGRGILDCSGFERADKRAQAFRKACGLPSIDTEEACHACVVYASENIRIEGITIRDTPFWALIVRSGSRHITIDGVKIIGQWRYNSDGIDISASSDVVVCNCFVRSFDDCLVVLGAYLDTRSYRAENIRFEKCNLWCDWGASFKLWSQPYTNTFRNIVFRDSVLMHVMGKPLQVKDTCGSTDTRIENIRFENLEVDMLKMPIRGIIQKKDETPYPGDIPEKEFQFVTVVCPYPKEDYGNQHFVPVKDPTPYHSQIVGVHVKDIFFPAFVPPIVAHLETTIPGQSIRDITFTNMPPITIRRRP